LGKDVKNITQEQIASLHSLFEALFFFFPSVVLHQQQKNLNSGVCELCGGGFSHCQHSTSICDVISGMMRRRRSVTVLIMALTGTALNPSAASPAASVTLDFLWAFY
jgi:hypothetical protein